MRRVLMLTPWAPYPFDGGSKRVHSLCSLLRGRFRFSLLTFRSRVETPLDAAEDLRREHAFLRPVFDEVHWVERPREAGPERVAALRLPADVRSFYDEAMARRLRELTAAGGFDLLHVEFDLMAAYASSAGALPKLLTQHDMGSLSLRRSYYREMAGWGKLARIPEWLRRRRFAREASGLYDRVVTVTEPDARALRALAPGIEARAVPTGVDLEHFAAGEAAAPNDGARLVFVGHYPHYPNEDAALLFCREILPRVRARRADATFHAVGSGPTESLRRAAAADPAVVVTGTVPDVKPHLETAAVFVAPVRLGHGIKGKILEAFAMGVPVVASSRAAAGIDAQPGRDLLVADRPAEFAEKVLELLGSPARRAEIGARGREIARSRYDWRALAAKLGDLYDSLPPR